MFGIDPKEISYQLAEIDCDFQDSDQIHRTIPKFEQRFMSSPVAQSWVKDHYGHYFEFKHHWHYASVDVFESFLDFQEICQIWHGCHAQTKVSKHIEKNHFLLWKIANSHWHYGCYRKWNTLVRHLDGLKNIKMDDENFEVRLTHSSYFNPQGTSVHDWKTWLDGPFGLFIYYKGIHVLTVGFALSDYGIMISQVQLKHKKSNRFLFSLPKFYLEWNIDLLAQTFPNENLWLVEGESAVQAIVRSYGQQECKLSAEDKVRIANFYNHELVNYSRSEESYNASLISGVKRKFMQLQRKVTSQ